MGLRELKKTRMRQAVQRAATHLFSTQGYAATTVEQIAAAAEISTATFYRYYGDKEDIVFGEDDRALVQEVISARPRGEAIADTIGALFGRLATEVEGDRDAVIFRMELMRGVPDLRARRWSTRQKTADLLARLLAPQAGTEPDDPQLRLAIAVALAAEAEVLFYWARTGGTLSLAGLLADALVTIEPVLRRVPAGTQGHAVRSSAAQDTADRKPRAARDPGDDEARTGSGLRAARTAADATPIRGQSAFARRTAGHRPAAARDTTPLPP
jgi:AcrR family transcriptional regulator